MIIRTLLCYTTIEILQNILLDNFHIIGADAGIQTFSVSKDQRLSSTDTTIAITKKRSSLMCSASCLNTDLCCNAMYNEATMDCTLDSCCNPSKENAINTKIMLKSFSAELSMDRVDCSCLPAGSQSGVYVINPTGTSRINVFCDMSTTAGGWTVVQRRKDDSVDFYRNWADYKTGFGDITGNFWLGNDNLNIMTHRRSYKVRFDLEAFTGETAYAEYTVFIVADEPSKYRVTNGGYSGTAGDAFAANNNYMFSTTDQDNDIHAKDSCADWWQGGWWYKWCGGSNVNGPYQPEGTTGYTSIFWNSWKGSQTLKKVEMKIRPTI